MPADEQPSTDDRQDLQAAFAAFNRVSGELQQSYDGLQAEVRRLQAQLAEANRKGAAEARRNAELAGRLAALLQALPGGVLMLDGNGVIRELNAAATDFLGAPLKDTAWSIVRERAFRSPPGGDGDLRLQDGRQLSLAQRLLDPGPGRVLLFTDVTEHRKVQELVARHRRLAALGEMAAALAHQIRTPLSAALLYTDNAARPGLAAEKRQALLDKAGRCLHDLEQLVADMLQFARGAHNAGSVVKLRELIDSVRTGAAGIVRDAQAVRLVGNPPELEFRGNREALSGAVLNLVSNALQHGGDRARVDISARRSGNDLEIRVRDDGPGIADCDREHIFDPFFTTRPDGTGLGLAVVRSVARSHGGDISLEDSTGPGASFVLRLPLALASDTEEAAA